MLVFEFSENILTIQLIMSSTQWQCNACTFINPIHVNQCEVCMEQRGATPHDHSVATDEEYARELQKLYNSNSNNNSNTNNNHFDSNSMINDNLLNDTPTTNNTTHLINNSSGNNSKPNTIKQTPLSHSHLNNNEDKQENDELPVTTQNTQNKKRRKREIHQMSKSDNESDNDENVVQQHFNTKKPKAALVQIRYSSTGEDIIRASGYNYSPPNRPWDCKYVNPVLGGNINVQIPPYVSTVGSTAVSSVFSKSPTERGKGVCLTSNKPNAYPMFTIEFNGIEIELKAYSITHPTYMQDIGNGIEIVAGNNGFLTSFSIEGSNSNDILDWILIHKTDSINGVPLVSSTNPTFVSRESVNGWNPNGNSRFFKFFRCSMTDVNSDKEMVFKLRNFKLFGNYKITAKPRPHKDEISFEKYPKGLLITCE
eukprot:267965_1